MSRLRNLPDGIRLMHTIIHFNFYSKGIEKARVEGDAVKEREEIASSTLTWAKDVAKKFRMDIRVTGRENIPDKDGFVFISNHQGYADIIAMFIAAEGRQIGFIAKNTLEKVPYFGKWIRMIRGLYIQRGSAKEALKSISDGASLVKNGYNLVIFPEGTRSRGPEMGPFKPGSFKLATKAKAPIVPVTINGSYHVFEEKGYVQPSVISVTIHPPVETRNLSRRDLSGVEAAVEETIRSALKQEQENEHGQK